MSKQESQLSNRDEVEEVCRPRGPLIYGRVSADVADELRRGVMVKGLRIWYRCSSCHRAIRVEDETKHNLEYHKMVQCPSCEKRVDAFQLTLHQKSTCPQLKSFCQYCSSETTLGDLQNHYDKCSVAKAVKFINIYPPAPPLRNISINDPMAQDLVNIAKTLSDPGSGDTCVKRLEKYKGPFGYQLYCSAAKEVDKDVSSNETLELRQHHQLQRHKQLLCNYLSKKLSPPQEKIKRHLQNYVLNRDAEIKLTKMAHPEPIRGAHSTGENPTVQGQGKPPMKKYTRGVHDYAASLCRQDARRSADRQRQQTMVRTIIKLNRRLTRKALQEDQTYVINDAIKLEQNKGRVANIREPSWNDFIKDLKTGRPVWPDLGLDIRDQNEFGKLEKEDEEMSAGKTNLRMRNSKALVSA